jgi:hypothetical protein
MAMDLPAGTLAVGGASARSTAAAVRPLSVRLRHLVQTVAGAATLTCSFVPGGRNRGAGIVSRHHCVTCNQSLMWHEVAAAIPDVELAEAIKASRDSEGGPTNVTDGH